ncbi:hypothetical protein N0V93_008717 [Gnomoniopsis smithogilvyi]|uniref:FAD-binding FR-type domain-containing protein n=1 Tax=Gnomoniopsis smithogilvyi TaxID=1191159 RepID=A0A9W9CV17_9PEZI|nr:hypothetical protein N0V93_008717 [Gnomoniopsis smithogilvyi]
MGWPWRFVDSTDAAALQRRHALDRYAGYAQLSSFGPIFLVLIYRLAWWVIKNFDARKADYAKIPESPARKARRKSPLGAWEAWYRLFQWWLGEDVIVFGQSWGRRDEWVFGIGWGAWMFALSVLETGDDYLHVTKRVGIIGISQLPLQYLLSLKSLNPIAFVLRSSHEEINRFHRALGRIIYLLLSVHAVLYLNFFIQKGILISKLTSSRAVQTGIIGVLCFNFLGATALKAIRTYSYRIFFITHLTVALVIPPLIWFHAKSAKIFVVEALVVFLIDIVSRKLDTVTSEATFESIPGSSLVKVTTSVPFHKIQRFRKAPGSHIYLQIPGISRLSQDPVSKEYLVHEFLFNPFTVASVDDENGEISLVARHQNGPTTSTLKQLAAEATTDGTRHMSLAIEGPYGAVSYYPELTSGEYDRVLLVSGGVGATFTVPLYRALTSGNSTVKVQLVWAVGNSSDAVWAKDKDGKLLADDEDVQLFVTGTKQALDPQGESMELSTIPESQEPKYARTRPDLRKIVDDVFRAGQEERIAVLFCGPTKMGHDLRRYVGVWVKKGRVVFWHSESFEW